VYIQRVTADHPDVPCFLFGHSTGGAIALKVSDTAKVYYYSITPTTDVDREILKHIDGQMLKKN
jgi:alpha-beta hydrolase superfamily lysophospholipase